MTTTQLKALRKQPSRKFNDRSIYLAKPPKDEDLRGRQEVIECCKCSTMYYGADTWQCPRCQSGDQNTAGYVRLSVAKAMGLFEGFDWGKR